MNPDVERLKNLAEAPVDNPTTSGAPPSASSEEAGRGASRGITAERLVTLLKESGAHLFHDQFQTAYAWVPVRDHRETLKIQGKRFQEWLVRLAWTTLHRVPPRETVQASTQILAACARFDGPEYPLGSRVMRTAEAIWYDLGNQVVKVTEIGWDVRPEPYPLFLRYSHQREQVTPILGGDLQTLLQLINLPCRRDSLSSDQLLLLVAIVVMMVPDIAHPVLCIHAEQGSGKTTMMQMLRDLIDPSGTPTLSPPDSIREFIQLAAHHYVVFLDNLSTLPEWLSDAICRCVTGEGFTKRELYSDDEDMIYSFRRSVGLNGINLVPSKPDLLDRVLILSLERIPDTRRTTETQLWETFNALKPQLLGAVFTLVSSVLTQVSSVTMVCSPRLADFAKYGVAAAMALGVRKQVFLDALMANAKAQTMEAIQASPVAQALLTFLDGKPGWSGSPSALREELNLVAEEAGVDRKSRLWPKDAGWVSRRLKEVRPNLMASGWRVHHRVENDKAVIEITRVEPGNDADDPGGGSDQPREGDRQEDMGKADSTPHQHDPPQNLTPVIDIPTTGIMGIISSDSPDMASTGWPIALPGYGVGEQADYEQCHACQEGSWQRYGGVPFCRRHALEELRNPGSSKTSQLGCDRATDREAKGNHLKGEHAS